MVTTVLAPVLLRAALGAQDRSESSVLGAK
jgi:hypothetical protein